MVTERLKEMKNDKWYMTKVLLMYGSKILSKHLFIFLNGVLNSIK